MKSKNSRVVYEIRHGLIVASVRLSRRKRKNHHTIAVYRLFRNGQSWTKSVLFGPNDLPAVRFVLDDAHTWILNCQTDMSSTGE